MDLILATSDGKEERVLTEDIDIDIGNTNDFVLYASYGTWQGDLQEGKMIYIPGTEYGGIIKCIKSATNTGKIDVKGFTWRGYLAHRFIIPPSGSDYYIASGDANSIINALVNIPNFVVSTKTSINISSYQFNRYVSVDEGLNAMLASVGYRLDIKYIQTQAGGYVFLQAVPAVNYGDTIEYSQDSPIDFSTNDDQMGVNHLICLGKGELKDRLVVHLYADKDGNISQTQSIYGIDEIVETYESSGSEYENLIESGTKKLGELISKKTFTAAVNEIEQELYLGDTVSGVDYITSNAVTKPIMEKIVKIKNGRMGIDYKIEE